MRKLRLEVEGIRVQSFTAGASARAGTVRGNDATGNDPQVTCGGSCRRTCETCMGTTCESGCVGTCASGNDVCCA